MSDAPSATTKQSPLHEAHLAAKGRMVPFAGYELPVQYAGLVAEHTAVRTAAGLFDVSHMGELELEGPGAVALVDSLVTNAISTLPVGRAAYTVCCNAQGTILDDLIIYRRGESKSLVVCNASNREKILEAARQLVSEGGWPAAQIIPIAAAVYVVSAANVMPFTSGTAPSSQSVASARVMRTP